MRPIPMSKSRRASGGRSGRSGFTLVELLVVMLITLIVSAAALPVVLPALSHREVSESARILQAALVGARDAAIHANAPRGIRLLPDPNLVFFDSTTGQLDSTKILAANRIVALEPAPEYHEGRVNVRNLSVAQSIPLALPYPGERPYGQQPLWPFDGAGNLTAPVLLLEEAITTDDRVGLGTRTAPTSWFWNVRLGDKIQIGGTGPYYTVVGPMNIGPAQGNAELFVNIGLPGQPSPLYYYDAAGNQINPHEFLFLVNGRDDNSAGYVLNGQQNADGNGYIDEGWDGVDNNLDGYVDNLPEWQGNQQPLGSVIGETEQWLGALTGANGSGPWYYNLPYSIVRRPTPSANARETMLPASVVVDLTTWGDNSPERSRLPVNRYTGNVDIMVSPQGEVMPNTIFSSPTSFTLADSYFHFWLAERSDLYNRADFQVSGVATLPNTNNNPQFPPFLPTPVGLNPNTSMFLEGESRLLTLFTRNGQITVDQVSDFDTLPGDYNTATNGVPNYNPSLPLLRAQQGVRGGQ